MNKMWFKAYPIFYENLLWRQNSKPIMININNVVRVEEMVLGGVPIDESVKGRIFVVDTVNDYHSYSLRMTSKYLEQQMENNEE